MNVGMRARFKRLFAVNLVQRFSSTLNLNVHFHALALYGVFTRSSAVAEPVFHPIDVRPRRSSSSR